MRLYDVCVVGGGLAGLTTAYFLLRYGVSNIVLLEARSKLGGLLRSEHINGYTFDVGGSHIIFSKDKLILNEILGLIRTGYLTHRRNSKIYINGKYIKYPFENGIKDLPLNKRFECLRDLVYTYIKRVKGELRKPSNFLEWMYYVFGNCIVNTYLRPYNEKLWKIDLSEITLEWVSDRVPNPPLDDVMKSAVGIETEGYKHQLIFHYPLSGGIQSLIDSLMEYLNNSISIKLGYRVERIYRRDNVNIIEAHNDEFSCRYIVYSAPLNNSRVFSELLGRLSSKLSLLKSVPLAVVSLGIKSIVPPYHWVYVPQKDIPFHRFAFLSNYSPLNAPRDSSSMIAEVSFKDKDELTSLNEYTLIRRVIEGFETLGIVRTTNVEVTNVSKWPEAYIVYNRDRSEILNTVIKELITNNVYPHGRFGSWEYINMDVVFKRSKELAHKIASKLGKVR